MGVCGCGSENNFFQIDKKTELIVEKFDDCQDCGGQNIQINILKEKDRDCFGEYEDVKKKKLSYWAGEEKNRKSIIIDLGDFKDSLKRKAEETFEAKNFEETKNLLAEVNEIINNIEDGVGEVKGVEDSSLEETNSNSTSTK